jgi:hypothetical protein
MEKQNKPEPEKRKLERITMKEYEELLIRNIRFYKQQFRESQDELNKSIDNYHQFLIDKNDYRLECYNKGDGTYIYKKFKRQIGFNKNG